MKGTTKKQAKKKITKKTAASKTKVAQKRQWVWASSAPTTNPMFEVEVSLAEVEPKVWRRFLIAMTASFAELHKAIQDACGWQNYHAWAFRDAKGRENIAGPATFDDMPDARKVKLADHVSEKGATRFIYEYDFGDGWLHEVSVKKADDTGGLRRLLGGARSFPPEDCGGPPGYERYVELVETGVDPWGEDARELKKWLGKWQPDAFKLEAARKNFDS